MWQHEINGIVEGENTVFVTDKWWCNIHRWDFICISNVEFKFFIYINLFNLS